MSAPIADHALLSDCQGAALVGRDGSVDWWCAPRFDSRAAFCRLLDPGGGHFALRMPDGTPEWRYRSGSMVLETTWTGPDGVVQVLDALAVDPDCRGHDLGRHSPHALVRHVVGVSGSVRMTLEWSPRLEFGLVTPQLARVDRGVRSVGGPDSIFLQAPDAVSLSLEGADVHADFTVAGGEELGFASLVREGYDVAPPEPVDVANLVAETDARWREWADEHIPYRGYGEELVARSALVLHALTYAPTGAMVAAPTTSLPEVPGGEANWDYRFCWLRDASLVVKAHLGTGCTHEAERFFDFLAAAAGPITGASRMQIVYGIGAEHDLGERKLAHLAGYGGAVPVRVGNGAWDQQQLDVPGYVLDAACELAAHVDAFPDAVQSFLRALADHAAEHWSDRDSGIWEGREGEREYLPSKVLCWVALDRAVRLADDGRLGEEAERGRWAEQRDAVRAEVLERGFHHEVGAFTGAFESDHHDAAVLLMPLLGFLPADDERMAATIDAVERDLVRDGLVMRWTGAEAEGRFLACSFWLAEALALRGDAARAREVFERAAAYASDLGLLAEMADPVSGVLLGNHPQALTHVALVNAATCIERLSASAR